MASHLQARRQARDYSSFEAFAHGKLKYDGDPYIPPGDGIFLFVPQKLIPLADLVRLDKPGLLYFYIPMLSGALESAIVLSFPPWQLAWIALKLLLWSVPLTFVNYSWNDTVDADIDRYVYPPRHGPIARNAISTFSANVINACLAALCVFGLQLFAEECSVYMIPISIGTFVYPLSKRFIMYPQVVFGILVSMGVFLGSAAVGVAPLVDYKQQGGILHCFKGTFSNSERAILWLFAANVAWAICYKIVYSFRDVNYDSKAGARTIALLIREKRKRVVVLPAAFQIMLFALTGWQGENGALYFLFSVAAAAVSVIFELTWVNLNDPARCFKWFSRGALVTGSMVVSGLLLDYSQKLRRL